VGESRAPILLGIPKDIRELMAQVQMAMYDRGKGCQEAHDLKERLQVVVLDEADKLLDSASLFQANIKKKSLLENQYEKRLTKRQRQKVKQMVRETDTETMFRTEFPKPLSSCQFICTSASVGRTLRRQLQGLLDATSIESAATLISSTQLASQRRKSLMPASLEHKYMFVDKGPDAGDSLERLAEIHAEVMRSAMDKLPPKPAIIFCGKEGADRLLVALHANGMTGAQRLREAYDDDEMEHDLEEHEDPSDDLSDKPSWDTIPLLVGSEAYGRGLDLDVDYVFMANPPSSSGRYMHMAGRTGRRGKYGIAITMLEHCQAPLMQAFHDHLGITFTALDDGS